MQHYTRCRAGHLAQWNPRRGQRDLSRDVNDRLHQGGGPVDKSSSRRPTIVSVSPMAGVGVLKTACVNLESSGILLANSKRVDRKVRVPVGRRRDMPDAPHVNSFAVNAETVGAGLHCKHLCLLLQPAHSRRGGIGSDVGGVGPEERGRRIHQRADPFVGQQKVASCDDDRAVREIEQHAGDFELPL